MTKFNKSNFIQSALVPSIIFSVLISTLGWAQTLIRPIITTALFANQNQFAAIDRHALKAPASAKNSVKALAAYLTKPAQNDLQKARALYRWVTANIAYDTQGYFSGSFGDLSPQGVLRSGKGVCSGYSRLYKALADAAGLECVEISGHAKGYGYYPGQSVDDVNHAWNAVKINKKWYLIDSTWGAGALYQGRFMRRFKDHFFMTPPEIFIYRHYPQEKKWQLLEKPISKAEYKKHIGPQPDFYDMGFNLDKISHRNQTIASQKPNLALTLTNPQQLVMAARVFKLRGNTWQQIQGLGFVQKKDDTYNIDVALPRSGNYMLMLFAKHIKDKGSLTGILKYRIEGQGFSSNPHAGFPVTFKHFKEQGGYLHKPMTGHLKNGSQTEFKLYMPRAEKVAVIIDNKFHYLEKKEKQIFSGKVKIHGSPVNVMAKFPENKPRRFSGLLQYKAK
jgi:hypothetical protein